VIGQISLIKSVDKNHISGQETCTSGFERLYTTFTIDGVTHLMTSRVSGAILLTLSVWTARMYTPSLTQPN